MHALLQAALVSLAMSGHALAAPAPLPAPTKPAKVFKEARPVAAWEAFCKDYASECAVDTTQPDRIKLDARTWALVRRVNADVNARIKPVTDQDKWGVPDRWTLAEDGTGDAEDYSLLKRNLLAKAGLPRRAMRITVVIDERGEGHAVLCLLTDRGDFILDNKTSQIEAWLMTGYVFIKRESQDALAWVSLGGATSPKD